jgi:flagellar L-ring protein precursor FlgH
MRTLLARALLAFIPALLLAQSPGSLFTPGGPLANPARDLRAQGVGDIVTIVVADRASAVASGGTNTNRASTGSADVTKLFGAVAGTPLAGPLGELLDFSNERSLQGQGETTRDLTLTTTLSARVVAVTLNGLLAIEGSKEVTINSERQRITLKGLIRPVDVSPANAISSNQISDLTIEINGKGVVGDAIRRPFILYRILTGWLPF